MTVHSADILIVGGGLMGVSLAHELAATGANRVLVLEQQQVGAGSTGRSVATLHPLTTHPAVAQLHQRTLAIYQGFETKIGVRADLESRPMAVIADEPNLSTLQTAVQVANAASIHMEQVSPGDFKQAEPDFNPADVAAIAVSNDAGVVSPEPTTVGYRESAKAARVGVWEHVGVRSLVVEEERVIGVESTGGKITAETVILAAGAWTGRLLENAGLHNPFTDRDQIVGVFDVPPHGAPLTHTVIDLPHALTYRFAMTNRYVFQPLTVGTVTESALNADPSLYVGIMSDLREKIVARFPVLDRSVLQPGWSGLWNLTPDGLPVAGETEINGLWVAAGFGNSGFLTIPALAEHLAAALLHGDTAPLAPFSPQRFPSDATSPWGNLTV
jgi:sarcosine oxidase, subunit beta